MVEVVNEGIVRQQAEIHRSGGDVTRERGRLKRYMNNNSDLSWNTRTQVPSSTKCPTCKTNSLITLECEPLAKIKIRMNHKLQQLYRNVENYNSDTYDPSNLTSLSIKTIGLKLKCALIFVVASVTVGVIPTGNVQSYAPNNVPKSKQAALVLARLESLRKRFARYARSSRRFMSVWDLLPT
jgi:hypothetical protein